MWTKSNNLKNALCYIPPVSLVLFFVETKKTDKLMKHIKYASILLFAYMIIQFILWFIMLWFLNWLVTITFICISLYLWYKAYNWEDVHVEYIDKLEEKIKDSMKNTK